MIKVDISSVSYSKGIPDIIRDMSCELEKGFIPNFFGQNTVKKSTLIQTLMKELQNHRRSIKEGSNKISSYSIRDYA